MLENNREVRHFQIYLILLGITICLWSTTWELFNLIGSSHLFYLSVILVSTVVFLFLFDLKEIQASILFLAISFLTINTLYFLVGIVEYTSKGYNIFYIIEYYIKQNICIIFCLFFSKYLFFNEQNIDKFIKTTVFTYIIIFSILIFVYIFIYKSDYIGTRIDFDLGRNRGGKNTLGIFIVLIFPFILSYIFKSKNFFVGSVFLSLYSIMIYKIDSSAVVIITLFQLSLYFLIFLRKLVYRLAIIIFCLIIIVPNFILQEFKKSSNISTYIVEDDSFDNQKFLNQQKSDPFKKSMSQTPFLFLDSHRGRLLHSALQKVEKDFFLGSGVQSFRIRDDNFGSLTETHNSYVSILVDNGILGLFLYLFFYFFIFLKIFKKNKYYKLANYDLASIIYILSLLLSLNLINFEYTLSIWLLNGICISRAFAK